MKTFKNFITEDKCDLVGMKQIKAFESIVDKLFKKYGIDFKFTRHFGDRMGTVQIPDQSVLLSFQRLLVQ